MMYEDLPVIVVSAATEEGARYIISQIIDNEVTEMYCKNEEPINRVWRISNKYYSADVCFQTFIDGTSVDLLQLHDNIEAHLLYITTQEFERGDAEMACEMRAAYCHRNWDVRIMAIECTDPPDTITSLALRHRYELVPLFNKDTNEPPDAHIHADSDAEERGVCRVRAALHAHTWRGLQLTAATKLKPRIAHRSGSESSRSSSCDESESYTNGRDTMVDDDGVESFATLLGAVRSAAHDSNTLTRNERNRRAEHIIAAVCQALGNKLDLDTL